MADVAGSLCHFILAAERLDLIGKLTLQAMGTLTGILCSDGAKIINIDSIVGYPHPKSVTDTGNEGALVYPVQEHMQEHLQSML